MHFVRVGSTGRIFSFTTYSLIVVRYHYIYSDNQVVLVEPSSRKVVQIIE